MQVSLESLTPILFWGAFIALMYFLLIRPQQVQQKKRREMLANVKKGDNVILFSGIMGIVKDMKDNILIVEVAPQVVLKVVKEGVAQVQKEKE